MAYSAQQLDQAISNVLGEEVAAAMVMGCIARPSRHREAILKAFVYGCSDEDAAILREAQLGLNTDGEYTFSA